MIPRIAQRLGREERGFTLPEVLVVMIVIGLLAAIAYAVFLGQRTKAKDAEAKDNVAALALDVESCRVDSGDFKVCDTKGELNEASLPIDGGIAPDSMCTSVAGVPPQTPPGAGKVAVIGSSTDCYLIMAQTDDGHTFWLLHRGDPPVMRYCTPPGPGGCHQDASTGDPTVGSWSKPN
jgi:prepilin-type N-terminal cleavage/methylation domain-containing protein